MLMIIFQITTTFLSQVGGGGGICVCVCVCGREHESSITSFLIMGMRGQLLKLSTLISTSLSHQSSIVGGAGYTGNCCISIENTQGCGHFEPCFELQVSHDWFLVVRLPWQQLYQYH